jgi:pyrroline-5-carboxylate reductase
MKIGFIGGGNMAEAMLSAILKNNLAAARDVTVSDIDINKRNNLEKKYSISTLNDNQSLIEAKEVIILAVKPQILSEIMPVLKGRLQPSQLVISILAGKSIFTLSSGLAHDCIVRSMPNTPAQIGEGMTVWTATPQVTVKQKKMASAILGSMGAEICVDDEKYLDMATAVSGSGPAYVFLFIESMVTAAVRIGWTPEAAQKLVMQTLKGSVDLLQKSGKTPQELRRMVTSPGGTTAEAIAAFEKDGFTELVSKAFNAAYEKAKKLGG